MESFNISLEALGVNEPYNLEAEQAVLGAVIVDSDALNEVLEILKPEHFFSVQHSAIFSEILQMFTMNRPIDYITVLDRIKALNLFDSDDAAKTYLFQLTQTVPSIDNIATYANIVYDKYLMRSLMNAAKDILASTSVGQEEAKAVLEAAEQSIYDIRRGRDNSTVQILGDAITEALGNLHKLSGDDRDKYLGIKTGFTYVDNLTGGFNKSDLVILAARPGIGKTSLSLNIAVNVAKGSGLRVAIFSLEMSKTQLAQRILSSESGVSGMSMRLGKIDGDDWTLIAEATERMNDAKIYLDDTSSITVPEVKAKIRRIGGVDMVIIDYLQLMASTRRSDSRVQEISEITRNLKGMAKELDVPIIALSQLSRNSENRAKESREPMLSDLRDSGSIEQDADMVLFLYREASGENGEDMSNTTTTCIVAKNRHGSVGRALLGWDAARTRFTNVVGFEQ